MAKPYVSEITSFIADLKQKRPTLDEEQRRGRALLWDRRPLDLEEQRRQAESRVPMGAYPYQPRT